MMNARDGAVWWIKREFCPLPVNWMEKGATIKGWPDLRITLDTVDQYFNGEPQNISLLMGIPHNVADVDKDCVEAYWAGREYLPATGMRWGRPSNPDSHALYFTEPAAVTAKYLDPVYEKDRPADACIIELRCRTKDGKPGFPVIAPPSRHPSGEDYEFTGGVSVPATIGGPQLGALVRLVAAASALGRHAREGLRHEIFIALAGAFARAKWELTDAQRFLRAVYRVIWHEAADLRQANADVDSTYQRYDDGGEITGLTKLGTLIDERLFRKLKEWLGLHEEWDRQQAAPKKEPRIPPGKVTMETLRDRTIITPGWLIEDLIKVPSLTLLVSPPKIGKTVLAMQMMMSIVNGVHLFDNYSTRQSGAGLILEWDDQQAESSLKDFLLKCRASREGQIIDYILRPKDPDFTIADPEFRPWLTAQIRDSNAIVVILDSLTTLRGFGFDDKTKNVVKLEAAEVSMLAEIAIECQCAIIVIHHDSKSAANLDIFSRAAGTYALQACTEAQIVLGRFPDLPLADPARLISVRGRHLRGLQAVLKFREESLDFDFLLDGDAARHYVELRQLLRAFRGVAFDAKQIEQNTGWGRSKAYALLSQLTGAGVLIKDSVSWRWNDAWTRTLEQI